MNAIDFDYPECGANPGERCHTHTGKWEPAAHRKRKHIVFEEEMRRNTAEEEIEEHATLRRAKKAHKRALIERLRSRVHT